MPKEFLNLNELKDISGGCFLNKNEARFHSGAEITMEQAPGCIGQKVVVHWSAATEEYCVGTLTFAEIEEGQPRALHIKFIPLGYDIAADWSGSPAILKIFRYVE